MLFSPTSKSTKVSAGPQLLLQIFARHDPPRVCHQLEQHAKGLLLQLDPHTVLAQISLALGKLEWSEAENAVALG